MISNWQEKASCTDLDSDIFFELYETDPEIAKETDQICLDCPVRHQCLTMGLDKSGILFTGVFGGLYLSMGKPSKNRNKHKDPYVYKKMLEEVSVIEDNIG